jgi:transcriptional regulator with XRE-family HTH domain
MIDKMETVGGRIRQVRNQRGLTLDQVAEKAGISKSFLWEVEHDRSDISGDKLLRVANVLSASIDFLLRGEPAPADYQPPKIEIPQQLGELAEEFGLTYRQTLTLLEIGRSVVARRSSKKRMPMSKEDWRKLYDGVKAFLEEKH